MRELSLHILDVLQNGREAGATEVRLTIDEDHSADRLSVTVEDNGRGMNEEIMERVLDPFFTTRKTRHVGLGLPLFAAAAQRCNGNLKLDRWKHSKGPSSFEEWVNPNFSEQPFLFD